MFLLCVLFALEAIGSPAQTFTTLLSFNGTDGKTPAASLIQGFDGNFYGTTNAGGAKNDGTVFKISPGGALTTLHSFDSTDGASPWGLVQVTDGNLYGTTYSGGAHGYGTVFKITPGGVLTTLYSFCAQTGCTDGRWPYGGLVQATDGNFYGTTYYGGANDLGTVFKFNALDGKLTTLHSFDRTDGSLPQGTLVQATDGNLYGTTSNGGTASGPGTVFQISLGGKLSTLYSFCSKSSCADGDLPTAGLVQATNGNLYGTTASGGANDVPACSSGVLVGCGTVFRMTTGGALTTLHSFDSTDGARPYAGIIQATDGSFYGATFYGGASSNCTDGCGTLFKITPGGTLTTLHSFDGADGAQPYAGLLQATNGTFYGTTDGGGAENDGTVFSLSVGLGPFVETDPTSGAVGTAVMILGINLTGATGVSFNGTAATFTVVSSTEIQTTVPVGATTGTVQVTTPSGTLNSNVAFQVTTQGNTPQAQIVNLENTVNALVSDGTINPALGQRLLAPLSAALRALDAGHATEAIRHLDGFIIEVRLLVILGRLTPAVGSTLIAAANSIITALGG
jgi:uncharacterized repeat protein (TIGR03803 family)